MMQHFALLLLITIFLFSCTSNKTLKNEKENSEVIFSNQEFELDELKGKWLTNSPMNKNSFVIFQENFYVKYDDNRIVPYMLKEDSIFIYFDNMIAKGRLISLTKDEVEILWGISEPKERITYYRP